MAGLLDDEASPLNQLIALAQAASSFRGTPMDGAYHKALLRASQNALAQPSLNSLAPDDRAILGGAQPVRGAQDIGYVKPGQQLDPNAPGMAEVRRWLQQQDASKNY